MERAVEREVGLDVPLQAIDLRPIEPDPVDEAGCIPDRVGDGVPVSGRGLGLWLLAQNSVRARAKSPSSTTSGAYGSPVTGLML